MSLNPAILWSRSEDRVKAEHGNAHITDSWSHQPRYVRHGRLDPAQALGQKLHEFLYKLGVADDASVPQSQFSRERG